MSIAQILVSNMQKINMKDDVDELLKGHNKLYGYCEDNMLLSKYGCFCTLLIRGQEKVDF